MQGSVQVLGRGARGFSSGMSLALFDDMQPRSSLLALIAGVSVLTFADTASAVPGDAVDLDSSIYHSCAVTDCGDIVCWGRNLYGEASDHIVTSGWLFDPPDAWTDVSTGYLHTCGIDETGHAACWGNNTYGQRDLVIDDDVWQIAAGGYHTCVLNGWGEAFCNGYDGQNQASPPAEFFVDISAGLYHTCGLRIGGDILCWGSDGYGQTRGGGPIQALRPGEEFVDVEAGHQHTCGVTNYGTVYCWGRGSSGQLHPAYDDGRWGEALPGLWATDGDFERLDAGASGTCAILEVGMECWGSPFSLGGGYLPPSGFAEVDAAVGSGHACAYDTAGSLACWGSDTYGRATPDQVSGLACPPRFFPPLFPPGPFGS